MTAAIILAAGLSSRTAPHHKLLRKNAAGTPMIARTMAHVCASKARPIVVVTGYRAEDIRAALAGCGGAIFAHNGEYAQGLCTSLRTGIGALPDETDSALIVLADMPLVTPATLDRIIAAHDPAQHRCIVIPTHNGRRGNPVLWNRRFFPDLRALAGDQGGKPLFTKHAALIYELPCDDSVLQDFDTAGEGP